MWHLTPYGHLTPLYPSHFYLQKDFQVTGGFRWLVMTHSTGSGMTLFFSHGQTGMVVNRTIILHLPSVWDSFHGQNGNGATSRVVTNIILFVKCFHEKSLVSGSFTQGTNSTRPYEVFDCIGKNVSTNPSLPYVLLCNTRLHTVVLN